VLIQTKSDRVKNHTTTCSKAAGWTHTRFFTAVFAEFYEKKPVIRIGKQHRLQTKDRTQAENNVLVVRKTAK